MCISRIISYRHRITRSLNHSWKLNGRFWNEKYLIINYKWYFQGYCRCRVVMLILIFTDSAVDSEERNWRLAIIPFVYDIVDLITNILCIHIWICVCIAVLCVLSLISSKQFIEPSRIVLLVLPCALINLNIMQNYLIPVPKDAGWSSWIFIKG